MRVFEFDHSRDAPEALELDWSSVDDEEQLETWLHANPEVILNEPLLIFGRQWGLDSGVPDLLALDQWGNTVVIELKKGQSGTGSASEETILSQPWVYASDLREYDYEGLENIYTEYKAGLRDGKWEVGDAAVTAESLIEAHEAVFGGQIDSSEFNEYQRMVILAEKITSETATHVRELIDKGMEMQCVEVQQFEFPDGAPGEQDYSILVSSTVVDYPLTKVQPEDSVVDYLDLILDVRDRVYPEVADMTHLNERSDLHRTGKRQIGFVSRHPDHPDTVRYRFTPRIVEEGRAGVSIGLFGSDEDEKERVRDVVAEHADSLDGFEKTDEYGSSSNLAKVEFEMTDRDPDTEFVNAVAEEMVRLIEFYHPKLVDGVESAGE